ncbi:MAG: methylmalonyl Co-A mutase-associated GTPase MeaB [bacterium]|jgi:LAO/AO transport system kinase|nr:methylmalonyl Co-A mutase-associated GTPase MeaB [Planctomycetota bacterium]HIL53063.1 methylmalonyl Co-A mutase-associated GTPase MeaB [Planctomycetota bacterium]
MNATSLEYLLQQVQAGDRVALGQAITLIESEAPEKRAHSSALLAALPKQKERAVSVGISGVPGAGKSTLIEALGMRLVSRGKRVAVLAVDPSSGRSGGSIMADKTRMTQLARDERAFVRPSPASGALGGVARQTHAAMQLVEAAGFDVILIETVGVGQSETLVEGLVDFFLVLMLAGAGDELQGIKRGILELADGLAINKADGENRSAAEVARAQYEGSLQLLLPKSGAWKPRALCVSALEGTGLDELWALVEDHGCALAASGELDERRRERRCTWMWQLVEDGLLRMLRTDEAVKMLGDELEGKVREGKLPPETAADRITAAFRGFPKSGCE